MTTNYEKKEDLRQRIRNKDEDANVRYNLFINEIKKAVEIATYGRVKKEEANIIKNKNKKKQIVKKQLVSWWDKECEEVIEKRKNALKKFKRDKMMHNWIEFKKYRAMATKYINSKKRKEHANFCSSLNKFNDMRYVWNRMRIFKRVGVNINWNKWQTKNREEEIIQTVEDLSPPWVAEDQVKIEEENYREDGLNEEFTIQELNRALKMVKRNSAPGRDSIEYRMIQMV